jgi:hypothetical protein
MVINVLAGTLTAVLLLLAVAVSSEPAGMWFFAVLGGLFLALLLVNLIAGPSCKCHLRTAVQVEELVSLARLNKAERALALLRERIVRAQGALPPEEIPARYQQFEQATAAGYVADDPDAPPRMI